MIEFKDIKDCDLDQIFTCGQCFRWEAAGGDAYVGCALGSVARVERAGGGLRIERLAGRAVSREAWADYFDLGRDYTAIKKELAARDAVLAEAIKSGEGIRILNQEKWETLLSFIISQNNNIPRIKKCIKGLSELLGERVGDYAGESYYALPAPEVLAKASVEDLAPVRLGYRASYLIEAARAVAADGGRRLAAAGAAPYSEAFDYLLGLPGVGPKVANCILLFSMGKVDSFPVDVWVRRVMHRLYGIDESDTKAMHAYAREHFSPYGGIAQQYLFYHIRELDQAGR